MKPRLILLAATVLTIGGGFTPAHAETTSGEQPPYGLPGLPAADFNRLAGDLPFRWADANSNGIVEPGEISAREGAANFSRYVDPKSGFTKEFEAAYRNLVEQERRATVEKELAQGGRAVIATDFTGKDFSENDRRFAKLIVNDVAPLISELYQQQKGALEPGEFVFRHGTESDLKLFARNQEPWCVATETQNSPFCSADPRFSQKRSDAYPADLLQDAATCETLAKLPNGDDLMGPYTAVRKKGGAFVAVPLSEAYAKRMKKVAALLRKAAAVYPKGEEEALRDYLLAAAKAFRDNGWEEADLTWARMNDTNSKWYLRVGPDEVYFDPCQKKAGFELSFALVSRKSNTLKAKLDGLKQEMENRLAKLIGKPYQAKNVQMKTPEFVDIVWNAGDAKNPLGAVVGQTLPNWGKAAEAGRRIMNVTNFYTDAASGANRMKRAKLFFTEKTLRYLSADPEASLASTVIHEVAHNLGPDDAYKIGGDLPGKRFGRLSSVLEELKAQTGSSWYLPFLKEKGVFTDEQVRRIYTSNVFWCFNQISYAGMFSAGGTPKAYGQLAAIQVGILMDEGALRKVNTRQGWRFDIEYSRLPRAFEKIMKTVAGIKANAGPADGARKAAEEFVGTYVGLSPGAPGKKFDAQLVGEIARRYRSVPKESFDYEIRI